MEEIPFECRVILGKTSLSKEDFSFLALGDVLVLEQEVASPVRVEIGSNGTLHAFCGLSEGFRAVKVEGFDE